MTAKEKAKELFEKFSTVGLQQREEGYQCALLAVDEIIKVCPYTSKDKCDTLEQLRANDIEFVSYWQEVKTEIEKL